MKNQMKNLLFLLLLVGFSPIAFAQSYELGKVTAEELSASKHPVETEANAAYLFTHAVTDYEFNQKSGFELKTVVKQKIKIYTKDGLSFGTVEIPFYKGEKERERVSISDANVYNLEGGKVVRTKLASSGQFEEKTNKFWSKMILTFPNVKEGSIIELEYTLRSPFITKIDTWFFQRQIPVDASKFEFVSPEYLTFRQLQRGWGNLNISSKSESRKMHFTSSGNDGSYFGSGGMNRDSQTYKCTRFVYEVTNLESFEGENYVNSSRDYLLAMDHVLELVAWPNQPIKNVSTSWSNVIKDIYKFDSFTPEMERTGYFENDLKAFGPEATTRADKVVKAFNFVKSKVVWNEYVGFTTTDGVRSAYKSGSGNAAEINFILIAALRSQGIEAYPVLLSTRSNGRLIIPTYESFNYVVVGAMVEGGLVLMDAAQKYGSIGTLAEQTINDKGYMIKSETDFRIIDLNPTQVSRSNYGVKYKVEESGAITGQAKITHTENAALNWRSNFGNFMNEKNVESIEKMFGQIEIGEIKAENLGELSKPYEVNFDFTLSNGVDIVGNQMYITPMLFMSTKKNPFERAERKYPVEFSFPKAYRQNFSIEIPEGWEVDKLPESLNIATSPGFYTFRYVIQQNGNQIVLSVQEEIKQSVVAPEDYETLRQFAKQMIEKENEKIVLKRS